MIICACRFYVLVVGVLCRSLWLLQPSESSFVIQLPVPTTTTRTTITRKQNNQHHQKVANHVNFLLVSTCLYKAPPPHRRRHRHVGITTLSSQQANTIEEKEKKVTKATRRKNRTWEESFELLVSYKERNGNCSVPQSYKEDRRLGTWVMNQRKRKDKLSHERIAQLDSLGFTWSILDEQWNRMFEKLKEYKTKHGNCNVPQNYKNDSRLGRWVMSQRNEKANLSNERIAQLDSLGFTWSILDEQWNQMFERLTQYAKENNNGDCNIPGNNYNDVNKQLYTWVEEQRLRKSLLSEERRTKLDKLGLIWEGADKVKADQKWNGMYESLQEYKRKYGNCRVPSKWKEDRALGKWVGRQRKNYRKGLLREDRQIKLEEIDFTWKVRDAVGGADVSKLDFQWLVMYGILLNFLEEHGHCKVSYFYKKDESLGRWVSTQRKYQKIGSLRQDRKELLDDIGFIWSFDDQKDEQWREKYEELKRFKEQNGHLRLPETSKSLRKWVSRQRVQFAAGKMTQEKKAMLDEIGLKFNI